MNNNTTQLGAVISRLRMMQNQTQSEVAESLGISDKTLSKWENGASSPTPEMITALARYFGVSADYLLGLDSAAGAPLHEAMVGEILAAGKSDGIKQMFDLTFHMVEAYYGLLSDAKNESPSQPVLPDLRNPKYQRSMATSNEMFAMQVNSENINIFTMLLGSEDNFSFLTDRDKADRIAKLLTLLADWDAMRLIACIHTESFPSNFTMPFIAEKSGVAESRAAALLGDFCDLGICQSYTAHLANGDETVYSSYGDGRILTILSLCYEYVCGVNSNYYFYGGGCKMIREGGCK